ncbi:uncharacterized protein [Miscanthus floridulus]|uniref:uncharacterized protein n=1 Tax=Miscanthus floridulus TaxID=154761 RepID=UPI003457B522
MRPPGAAARSSTGGCHSGAAGARRRAIAAWRGFLGTRRWAKTPAVGARKPRSGPRLPSAEYAGSCAEACGWEAHDDHADMFADDVVGCGDIGARRWVPPHEVLQGREHVAASFSVCEGVNCTLKGHDLRRVRNTIWEKIGFQD